MAREVKSIDVSSIPELLRLAEEVESSQQRRVLRRSNQDLAIVIPLGPRGRVGISREQALEAQIWADVGVARPDDFWAGYDSAAALAALRQARGTLAGFDKDEFLKEIYEAREQDGNTRPA